MSETPPEVETGADRISAAVVATLGCIAESLPTLCSYGWTIGEAYVPFDPDDEDDSCDEEEVYCSQAWIRITGITPLSAESWTGDCAVEMSVGLEVGVLRCVDVPEDGEAPKATDVMVAAMQAVDDMNAVHCAVMDCEVWDSMTSGSWTPMGPLGGQHGGMWTFTATL